MKSRWQVHTLFRNNFSQIAVLSIIISLAALQGLVVWIDPKMAFLTPAAITGVILLYQPYIGLLSLLLLHPFAINASEEIDVLKIAYYIIFGLTLLGWFLRRGKLSLQPALRPIFWPVIALGSVVLLSFLPATLHGVRFEAWLRSASTIAGIFLMFPAAEFLSEYKKRNKFINVLMLTMWLSSFGTGYLLARYRGFISSPLGWLLLEDRPLLGGSLAISLMGVYLGLAFVIYGKSRRGCPVLMCAWPVAAITALFSITGLVLSGFLSVVILGLVGIPILLLVGHWGIRLKLLRLVGFLLICMIIMVILGYIEVSYSELFISQFIRAASLVIEKISAVRAIEDLWSNPSWLGRWYEAKQAILAWRESPIWGYGFGYEEFKSRYWDIPGGFYVHSMIPGLLVRIGLLGFFTFTWYLWSVLKLLYRAYKTSQEAEIKIFLLGGIAGLIAMLAVSQVSSLWDDRGFALMLGILSGLAAAVLQKPTLVVYR